MKKAIKKYKRKQNPALEIINKTIENKSLNDFSMNNLIGFKTYEKINFNTNYLIIISHIASKAFYTLVANW